jgi:hypothetical protein
MAPGVAGALGGEGGVCVALMCFVLVGVELPDNSLLIPRCIEQDDSNIAVNTVKNRIEYFFIFASKQWGQSYNIYINLFCVLLN